jgi:Icc-related predicted phosphoesterase
MKFSGAASRAAGSNCCCCVCSHHSSITHWNSVTRAWPDDDAYAKRPSFVAVSFLKAMAKLTLRIAATADLHYAKHSRGKMHDAFAEISKNADVLLLCGDLTEYGLPEEAEELAADIRSAVRIPCIGVIGNHDYESGHPETVANILDQTGVTMLNGEAIEIAGVGFAGICGFGGGFGRRMLNAWGEPLIKQFVQESISHAIRLEQALVKLQAERRIVVLHYSPIRATLQGEDPEIYAFLGSSRLEEPINRFRATAVFHGHAHNGITDGKTSTGIPVYNVSAPALHKTGKPYRIVEL